MKRIAKSKGKEICLIGENTYASFAKFRSILCNLLVEVVGLDFMLHTQCELLTLTSCSGRSLFISTHAIV